MLFEINVEITKKSNKKRRKMALNQINLVKLKKAC